MLSRYHCGPRAVLNALEPVARDSDGVCHDTASELAIAEGPLRAHSARPVRPSPTTPIRAK